MASGGFWHYHVTKWNRKNLAGISDLHTLEQNVKWTCCCRRDARSFWNIQSMFEKDAASVLMTAPFFIQIQKNTFLIVYIVVYNHSLAFFFSKMKDVKKNLHFSRLKISDKAAVWLQMWVKVRTVNSLHLVLRVGDKFVTLLNFFGGEGSLRWTGIKQCIRTAVAPWWNIFKLFKRQKKRKEKRKASWAKVNHTWHTVKWQYVLQNERIQS